MPAEPVPRRLGPGVLVAAGAILALDQITKAWVAATLSPGDTVPIVPGWFQLRFIVNRGGLFGMLRDLPDPWRAALFTGIPVIASLGLLLVLLRVPPGQTLLRNGLALILGGALGNLVDRLRLGHVVDFLDVFWRQHHWPAFNVADSAICVGVGLVLLDAFRRPAPHAPPPEG